MRRALAVLVAVSVWCGGCGPQPGEDAGVAGGGGGGGGSQGGGAATGGGFDDDSPRFDGGLAPQPAGPTSRQLIQTALTAGALTEEQALVYRLGLDFGWPAVPAAYHGDDSAVVEGSALDEALAYVQRVGEANVSAATLDVIERCQAPAYQEGSWWHRLHPSFKRAPSNPNCSWRREACRTLSGWASVETTHAVVWYEAGEVLALGPKATLVATYLESTIWPKLTGLMGAPLPDTDYAFETDGRLDFILVELPAGEYGYTSKRVLPPSSAKVYLSKGLSPKNTVVTAAHEFMHVVQGRFARVDHRDLTSTEATATWAEHFVFPGLQSEHEFASAYLYGAKYTRPWQKPDDGAYPLFEYGAYLFPFVLADRLTPSVVRQVWDAFATHADELEAYDFVLTLDGSSLEQEWKAFARAAWNQDTLDYFVKHDHAPPEPDLTRTPQLLPVDFRVPSLVGGTSLEQLDPSLEPASIAYYRVSFTDPAQRSVTFLNGWTFSRGVVAQIEGPSYQLTGLSADDRQGLGLQLYLKVNGAWQAEAIDASNWPWFSVCRDDPTGAIDELVLIFTNAATSKTSPNSVRAHAKGDPTALMISNVGCKEWTGTLSMSRPQTGGMETLTVSNARFTPLQSLAAPQPGQGARPYPLMPGESVPIGYGFAYSLQSAAVGWAYKKETMSPNCTVTGAVTTTALPVPGDFLAPNWAPIGPLGRGLNLGGFVLTTQPQFVSNWRCVDSQGVVTSGTRIEGTGLDLRGVTRAELSVDASGRIVSGTQAQVNAPMVSGSWSLQALP